MNKVESRVGKLYDLTTSYINPDRLPTLQDMLLLLWDAPIAYGGEGEKETGFLVAI